MRNLLVAGLLALVAVFVVPAPSHGAVATCQGKEATIVGPTDGTSTTGTEGDDVIVAPLVSGSSVQGLGGNDTICLVGGDASNPNPIGFTTVHAGDGDDSVLNETVSPLNPEVALGAGSDHYVGNDFYEGVSASGSAVPDTEVDVIETRGGNDSIGTGNSAPPAVENRDLIYTGAGRDSVGVVNPSGERIDNGTGADFLALSWSTPVPPVIDNAARGLSVEGRTLLTWTNADRFQVNVGRRDSLSFVGTDADETVVVHGPYKGFTPRGGSIATGGGHDNVYVESYLPRRVKMGAGADRLFYKMYWGCDVASIELDASAECRTLKGEDVVTKLAGIERLGAQTHHRLNVLGTTRRDNITANSPVVRVRAGAGGDRVYVEKSRISEVWGGRGDDKLKGIARQHIVLRGGRGADFLRGWTGGDRLYGGGGRDVALGRGGTDFCVAEVRRGCELPR